MPLGDSKLGEKRTTEQERTWWGSPGKGPSPTYEPAKDAKGGGAVIIGVGAAAVLLALLGLAAASGGAAPTPPTTKRKTSITITSWSAEPYDAGYNYSVQGVLKDETGAPVAGRTVQLYYCKWVGMTRHCYSIGSATTNSNGQFTVAGFEYIPLTFLLELIFSGDSSYYNTETDIEPLATYNNLW